MNPATSSRPQASPEPALTAEHIQQAKQAPNRWIFTQVLLVLATLLALVGTVFFLGMVSAPVDGAPSLSAGLAALDDAMKQIQDNAAPFLGVLATVAVALTLSLNNVQWKLTQSATAAETALASTPTRTAQHALPLRRRALSRLRYPEPEPESESELHGTSTELVQRYLTLRRTTSLEAFLAAVCAGIAVISAVVLSCAATVQWPFVALNLVLAIYITAESTSASTSEKSITALNIRIRREELRQTAAELSVLLQQSPARRPWIYDALLLLSLLPACVITGIGRGPAPGILAAAVLATGPVVMWLLSNTAHENLITT